MPTTRALGRRGLKGGDSRLWRIAALCVLLAATAIAAVGSSPALAASKSYTICTYTSNFTDAGTDSDVWVKLKGTSGKTTWLELDNSNDNFERGQRDCFYFVLTNLGTISELFLDVDCDKCWRLDGIGVNDSWFPYYQWVPEAVQSLHPA